MSVGEYLSDTTPQDFEHPEWVQAMDVLQKIVLAERNVPKLLEVVGSAQKDATGFLRVGIDTGISILEGGAKSIYDREFVARILLPPIIEDILEGLWNEGMDLLGKGGDVAMADLAGAVGGAIRGGIKGGIVGAGRGAVAGAVVGSLTGGTGDAW